MHDTKFVRLISDHAEDPTPKLVYADWLEEQGDWERAEFLRLYVELSEVTPDPESEESAIQPLEKESQPQLRRLKELHLRLDPEWLAQISSLSLKNCVLHRFRWDFKCSLRWEHLSATNQPNVRHCGSCEKYVYFCGTAEEARAHARHGRCVAIDNRLLGDPDEIEQLDPLQSRESISVGGLLDVVDINYLETPIALYQEPPEPPEFEPGDLVEILAGTFEGKVGTFEQFSRDRQYAIVATERFEKPCQAEIHVADLRRAFEA